MYNARITGASKVKTTYGNNTMSNELNQSDAKAHPVDTLVMLACPFCGAPAGVKSESATFQIIGCMTRPNETMLCPSPTMVVYKKEGGNFDYTYWNRRAT